MDTKSLTDRKQAVESSFSELSNKKLEIEAELARLQGEFRLITELLNKETESATDQRPDSGSTDSDISTGE